MRKMSGVCDYFVIASGTSTTHVRAIADNIIRVLKEKGERLRHKEGEREALWVLLDCGDVVAHVFLDETRRFYDLESLWASAPRTRFAEIGTKSLKKIGPKSRIKRLARFSPRVKARKKKRFKRQVHAKASSFGKRSGRSSSRNKR
jgi:ribosome-associated protein